MAALGDLYISGDIEADGRIPGVNSMVSFGLCVAGTYDGHTFVSRNPHDQTLYAELQPISDEWDPAALAVSGLSRSYLEAEGESPSRAMDRATQWVTEVSAGYRPIFVGYPAVFDWMFLYWYWIRFTGSSPFGFSGARDIKTEFAVRSGIPIGRAVKRNMPVELLGKHPHTHHALDDAIGQAELFINLMQWRAPSTVGSA